jgi:hypothetical protein
MPVTLQAVVDANQVSVGSSLFLPDSCHQGHIAKARKRRRIGPQHAEHAVLESPDVVLAVDFHRDVRDLPIAFRRSRSLQTA